MATNDLTMRVIGFFMCFFLTIIIYLVLWRGKGGASHMDPAAMGEIKETLPAQI